MKHVVTASYETHTAANQAVHQLASAGFDEACVSLMMSKTTRERHYPSGESRAARGTRVGAIIGGLTGIAMAPPFGLFVSGPLLAVLGATALGAAGGGVVGALLDMGVPEQEALRFESQLARGSILVGVQTENREQAAEADYILQSVQARFGTEAARRGHEAQSY